MASCRTRSTASAWPTPFCQSEGADTQEGAVFDNNGSRHLPGRLCRRSLRPAHSVVLGASGDWDSAKDNWELYDIRHVSEATDLAARTPKRLAAFLRSLRRTSQGQQGVPARRGHLAAPAPRGAPHQDALLELGVRQHHHPRMPEFTAPALGNVSNTVTIEADLSDSIGCALRTRPCPRWANAVHGQGPTRLRIQLDDHRAHRRARDRRRFRRAHTA